MQMKRAKLAYKNAIKAHQMADDSYFSNDLHELLLEKDMVEFWKSWNSKVTKAKPSVVIDNETDGRIIAEKFATHFQQSCTLHDTAESQSVSTAGLPDICAYISRACADDFSLLDVESVNKCMLQMAKGKAPGVDGIQIEHLLYAHPIVVIVFYFILC